MAIKAFRTAPEPVRPPRSLVQAGRAVWSCRVDVYVLEHDGCVTDAAALAALAALASTRLPQVHLEEMEDGAVIFAEIVAEIYLPRCRRRDGAAEMPPHRHARRRR